MNKNRLRSFRDTIRETRQIRDQLEALEARIYTPRAQRFSSTPRAGTSEGHTMDDLAAVHIELQDKYRRALADVEREQLAIEKALTVLSPVERMVVRYRYFDLLSWEDVCLRIHYGWSQTNRIHAAALKTLEGAEE